MQQTQTGVIIESGAVNQMIRNTYRLLGLTLIFSAITAGISMMLNLGSIAALVMMLAAFGVLFIVNKKADTAAGLGWIFAFTGLMGASLGPVLNTYAALQNGPIIIMQALGATALIFFALSAYAMHTKKDFSFMGGFLMVGLIVVVIASIANIFLSIPALSITISAVAVLVMSGLILFDTSRIINGGETNYIRATVALYLDVFNLFVHLLSLFGLMSDE